MSSWHIPVVLTQRQLPFGPVRAERLRPVRRLPGLRRQLGRRRAVEIQDRVRAGELGPGRDEPRVQGDRLLVEADGPAQARGIRHGHALRGGLAFEIGVVGRQVLGRLGRELVAHAVAQGHVERTGHFRRDVGLHLEDVGERRVERLLPLGGRRGPGLDPDQLGTHPHPARAARRLLPLHRGGEQVVGPQLAGDLLRRLGGVAVFVRAGPRDDREPRHLRELAAHLVR